MNPVTAFVVMLAGGALILLSDRQANRGRRLWGRVLAGIAAAVGVSRLLCIWYGCGCDNVLDHWVFGCRFPHGPTPIESIGIRTALNMLLAGSALLLLDIQTRRGHRPAEALSAISGSCSNPRPSPRCLESHWLLHDAYLAPNRPFQGVMASSSS